MHAYACSGSRASLPRAQPTGQETVATYQYTGPDRERHVETVAWRGYAEAVMRFLADLTKVKPTALRDKRDIAAVGHRIVHGGPFTTSVLISPEIEARLRTLTDLAPLHNPPSLETAPGRAT